MTRLLAGAGMLVLLGGMGVILATSGGTDGAKPPPLPTTTQAATTPVRVPTRPAAVAVRLTGIGAYDPEGDRSENGGDAGLATDGDPATAWKSERYRSALNKPGVGLVLDAGRSVKASQVRVATDTPGYSAEVQVGDSPAGPFAAASASKVTTAQTTFELKRISGRYLMLWITSLPPGGTAAVNEITAKAGG